MFVTHVKLGNEQGGRFKSASLIIEYRTAPARASKVQKQRSEREGPSMLSSFLECRATSAKDSNFFRFVTVMSRNSGHDTQNCKGVLAGLPPSLQECSAVVEERAASAIEPDLTQLDAIARFLCGSPLYEGVPSYELLERRLPRAEHTKPAERSRALRCTCFALLTRIRFFHGTYSFQTRAIDTVSMFSYFHRKETRRERKRFSSWGETPSGPFLNRERHRISDAGMGTASHIE